MDVSTRFEMENALVQAEAALLCAVKKAPAHGQISLTLIYRDKSIIRYAIQCIESTIVSKNAANFDSEDLSSN